MKTIKILLGIIAINLTLLTIIQTGIWPPKVQASETNISSIENYKESDSNYNYYITNGYVYKFSLYQNIGSWMFDDKSLIKYKKLPTYSIFD